MPNRPFTAEQVHLYVSEQLSAYPALATNSRFQEQALATMDAMCMTITTWCLSGRIPTTEESITVEWPDGVWQTFKYKFMPHWFTTRFPVRMASQIITTVTNHYFVCPHLVADPRNRHIQFMATGTPEAPYFGAQR